MKIHYCDNLPENFEYTYGDCSAFSESDLERLQKLDIDEAWYWYSEGSYEGTGQLLMRRGDIYDVHDMGHCSCYGPLDDAEFTPKYASLAEIKSKCSTEAYKEIAPLVDMALGLKGTV